MDKDLINLFQIEIKKQSSFALMSINYVNEFFADEENKLTNEFLWYHIQNFLVSSANISKLLWGSNKKENDNRVLLRNSLNVPQKSILFNREIRNDFEHYDERIETWYKTVNSNVYVDSNIGPVGMLSNIEIKDYLRNFDTEKGAITFKGKEYPLQPLVDEILKLNAAAVQTTS